MTISAIIYARSSIDCSASVEEQTVCLQAVATSHRWIVAKVFSDQPMPMKRGREQRPGETALLAAIRAGSVNRLLLFSIDRLGRTLPELIGLLETCREAGVQVYIHDRRIDTAMSNGLSLFDFGQMMALHLRQGRRDKILRGQAAARIANVRFGRPPIARGTMERAKAFLGTGRGVRETARLSGISAASVSKLKNVATSATT
jgi:DNA invertase Pin-like site-specific DNA recombinase